MKKPQKGGPMGKAKPVSKKGGLPASPGRSDSRARAKAETAPSKADRLQTIVDLMARGEWSPARAIELAAQWGISPSTVRDSSAEASRVVLGALGPPDEIRATVLGYLHRAIELAVQDPFPAAGARAVIAAVAEFARITGIAAPVKVAQTDTKGVDLPPTLRGIAGSPALLVWLAEHDRLPTEQEAAQLLAGGQTPG